MPVYTIKAPNGKTLDIEGDHVPTEAELHDIFAKAGVETGAAPKAGEATRQDTNIIGIDHDKILQRIADFASKAPEALRGPLAAYLTANVDGLASMVEMFSSPETVATAGAGALKPGSPNQVPTPTDMQPRYPGMPMAERLNSVGRTIERAGSAVKGDRGAVAQGVGKALQIVKPSMPEGYTQYGSVSTGTEAAAAAPKVQLSAQEFPLYQKLRQSGQSHEQAIAAVETARALGSTGSFAGLPSNQEASATIAARGMKYLASRGKK